MSSTGYVYCLSNCSMPGILSIGMTEKTPEDVCKEANRLDKWRPPTTYKLEIAKHVTNPQEVKQRLHSILEQKPFFCRVGNDFFRVCLEEVQRLFDLVQGEMWVEKKTAELEQVVISSDGEESYTCFGTSHLSYLKSMITH